MKETKSKPKSLWLEELSQILVPSPAQVDNYADLIQLKGIFGMIHRKYSGEGLLPSRAQCMVVESLE